MLEWLSGMTRNHMGITRNHINAYAWACWSGVVICVGVLECLVRITRSIYSFHYFDETNGIFIFVKSYKSIWVCMSGYRGV